MASNSGIKSVKDYIAAQPKPVQGALAKMRAAIRTALPKAAESISYGMPTYKLNGTLILYFAAWKSHVSLYPASAKLLKFFEKDLANTTINKSTIRFPLEKPASASLVGRIAKYRVKEQAERAKKKAVKKRAR